MFVGSSPSSDYVNGTVKQDLDDLYFVHNSIPLPKILKEQYDRKIHLKFSGMTAFCQMGLFPQINRAWFAIDNQLFLWNYKQGF